MRTARVEITQAKRPKVFAGTSWPSAHRRSFPVSTPVAPASASRTASFACIQPCFAYVSAKFGMSIPKPPANAKSIDGVVTRSVTLRSACAIPLSHGVGADAAIATATAVPIQNVIPRK